MNSTDHEATGPFADSEACVAPTISSGGSAPALVRTGILDTPPEGSSNEADGLMPAQAVAEAHLSAKRIKVQSVATERNYQARELDTSHVQDLAISISATGLLQPIVVRKVAVGYELVAGAHRLAALRELGLAQVDALVLNDATTADAEAASLVENLKRLPMTDPEKSRSLARLKELQGAGAGARRPGRPKKGAPRTNSGPLQASGVSRDEVKRASLRERKMAPKVREVWNEKKISDGQVDELVKVPVETQEKLLAEVVGKTRDETRALVKEVRGLKKPAPEPEVASDAANGDTETRVISRCHGLAENVEDLSMQIGSLFPVGSAGNYDGDGGRPLLLEALQGLRRAVDLALDQLRAAPASVSDRPGHH